MLSKGTLVLALLAASAAAHADDGTIVFARQDALYTSAPDGTDQTLLVKLPQGSDAQAVRSLEMAGRLLVVGMKDKQAWVDGKGKLTLSPCKGPARPAPEGECVACRTASGMALVSTTKSGRTRKLPTDLADLQFRMRPEKPKEKDPQVIGMGADGVVAFDPDKPKEREVLAKPGASSHLLVSPDGTRAVAVFGDGEKARIRSFLLDGEGVSRQLDGPGVPVVWSPDSTWVLLQVGVLANDPSVTPDTGEGENEGQPAPDPETAPPSDDGDGGEDGESPSEIDEGSSSYSPFLLGAPRREKEKRKNLCEKKKSDRERGECERERKRVERDKKVCGRKKNKREIQQCERERARDRDKTQAEKDKKACAKHKTKRDRRVCEIELARGRRAASSDGRGGGSGGEHADSKPPTTRACVARAVGGEVKCWDDYYALAFSPDSTRVLLKKGTTLYVGVIDGVRPAPPQKLVEDVAGAATWAATAPSSEQP